MTAQTLILDVGGQGCLACLVDRNGHIIDQAHRAVDTQESNGQVSKSGSAVMDTLAAGVDELLCRRPVARVGLVVERGSVLCWHRDTAQPLSPVLSWRDRRAKVDDDNGQLARLVRQRSGLRFSPYGGAAKLRWCVENIEAVAAAASDDSLAMGPLGAWLVARLTGNGSFHVDHGLAQRTLLWSMSACDWDPELLACFAIQRQWLPAVVDSRHDYGPVAGRGDASLALLMGDQNAVVFLNRQPDPDTLHVNLGTGAFLLRPVAGCDQPEPFQLTFLGPEYTCPLALEASVHGAASALNWLKQHHHVATDEQSIKAARAVQRPPLFINSIDGLGSPWWRPGPDPEFLFDDDSERSGAALLRAVLESIAFMVAINASLIEQLAGPCRRVQLSGGLSRNPLLLDMLAGLLPGQLQVLKTAEGTALGAWCRLSDRAMPDSAWREVSARPDPALAARLARWREIVEG